MKQLKASAGQAVYHDFIVADTTSVPAKRLFNAFTADGRLNRGKVERAVRCAIATHEALRTSLEVIDGELHQVVREPSEITEAPLSEADWDGSPGGVAEVIRSLDDRWAVPRQLSMHVVLGQASDGRTLVACVLDHACCDGMSAEIVADLIRAEYNRPGEGVPPGPVVQFSDYFPPMLEDGMQVYDEWLRVARGTAPALPDWMLDRKRVSGLAWTREIAVPLSEETNRRLTALAAEYVCTPYELMAIGVGLYFRREDAGPTRVAVTHNGRHRRHGFDVVGLLRSQVLDVASCRGYPDVRSFLLGRRDELRRAVGLLGRLPVEEICLRAGLGTGWRAGIPGLWEVELSGMHVAPPPEPMGGHAVEQVPKFLEDAYCENGGTTFLLNLFLSPGQIEATLRYVEPPVSTDLAKRVATDLEVVVEFLAADPDRSLDGAPAFSAAAREFTDC
ncbi:condensation domain-containing protein [Saccharopolyspora spinosa]|uniref:Condensation domain-containing protein n=1 Tax=Saccharopolyspora spinosa TaxID=60894 RepID=A0A2N3Y0U4_SACSN|nr:condensation domain-containing protein [Saccharopolyspora spinosa]PKW16548.1 condensation domain-containing protein [Saccharopolyspora spinosa]